VQAGAGLHAAGGAGRGDAPPVGRRRSLTQRQGHASASRGRGSRRGRAAWGGSVLRRWPAAARPHAKAEGSASRNSWATVAAWAIISKYQTTFRPNYRIVLGLPRLTFEPATMETSGRSPTSCRPTPDEPRQQPTFWAIFFFPRLGLGRPGDF